MHRRVHLPRVGSALNRFEAPCRCPVPSAGARLHEAAFWAPERLRKSAQRSRLNLCGQLMFQRRSTEG